MNQEHESHLKQVIGSIVVAILIVAVTVAAVTAKLGPGSDLRVEHGGHGGGGEDNSGRH